MFSNWRWARITLVGPLVFCSAFVTICAASVWWPAGPARIDNVAIPLVLFPALWAGLFFYSYLTPHLARAYGLVLSLLLLNTGLIAWQLTGAAP